MKSALASLIRNAGVAPLLVFLAIAFLVPVATVLSLAVWSPVDGFSLASLQRILVTPIYSTTLLRTLEISLWTTVMCLLGGFPIALLINRLRGAARTSLYLLVLLPLWTSFLVKSFAWLVLLGKNGAVNALIIALTGEPANSSLLFNLNAVLIGMVHGLMPFAVLTILPVLDAIDPRLTPAAASLGARTAEGFIRVLLPLAMPGVAAAGLIVFVTSVGFFIVPALLGGPRQTMVANVIIEMVLDLMNWPLASAAALLMFGVVAGLFGLYIHSFGIESLVGRARTPAKSAAAHRPHRQAWRRVGWLAWDRVAEPLGRWPLVPALLRHSHAVLGLALVLFLALPALFLIPVSFTVSGIIDWPPQFFSWRWYAALDSPAWRSAAWRSFTVACATGVLSLAMAYPAAVWLVRKAQRSRVPVLVVVMAPMIVPRIIIAIGLFYLFARLGLIGSWFGLVLGHTVIALPFVLVTMIAVVQAYDERLDQAAAVCGAGIGLRLRRVTLPLLAPGALSAFLFAFVTSLDELTIALFVTGGLSSTLPKQMWDEALLRVSPTLAAASTLIFLLMSSVVVLAQAIRQRRSTQPRTP
ncbi:MAG: binding-protein-dependent transport systems inner membrane component [Comamonadaceae bacterium]|nr:MAG: binding-protein-dependent transport systems inner membrane component [Comamonadaceae bacterium]